MNPKNLVFVTSLTFAIFMVICNYQVLGQAVIHTSGGETVDFAQETCSREVYNNFGFDTFHPIEQFFNSNGTLELLVRFKGVADGHILLTRFPNVTEPLYMIIIGSYNNRFTEIRRTKQAKPLVKLNTPGILSSQIWRSFVIRYQPGSGNIFIFPIGSEVALVAWKDPSPLQIHFFSFCSYNGRLLEVAFNCRSKDSSAITILPDCQHGSYLGYSLKNEYRMFKKMRGGIIRFVVRFRGVSDAHVILSPANKLAENSSYYSIVIGAAYNRRTYIRRNGMGMEVAAISTPNILTDDHYRGFIVEYNRGTGDLSLFPELGQYPILRWRDPLPLDVKYFSFTSYAKTELHVAFNCKGTDDQSLIALEEATTVTPELDFVLSGTPDPKIRKRLLVGYDSLAQPYPYMTTVTIPFMSVIHYDIDDQKQTFEVHAWIVMTWQDDRLRWSNFSGRDPSGYVHFARKEIWTPEIATYNTAKPTVMNDFAEEAQILVQSNGSVIWVPPVRFITNCKMNLLQWPFDEQRCYIKIGSWTFHENELDLQFDPDVEYDSRIKVMSYEGHNFPNNTQWVIRTSSAVRTAKTYSCCIEKYVDITYYFTLGRKSSIFTFTLVLPVLMITVVSLIGFMIPLAGATRLTLAGINFLVITAYMIYFRMRLPTIDHVPAIVRFFTWNLFMTTLNMAVTVGLINLTVLKGNTKIPDWAKVLLNSKVVSYISFGEKLSPARRGSIVKARTYSKKGDGENSLEEVTDPSNRNKSRKGDWTVLVDLFDKACFTLFSVISFIMAIALFV